jgi:hypothetical protein
MHRRKTARSKTVMMSSRHSRPQTHTRDKRCEVTVVVRIDAAGDLVESEDFG